MSIARHHAEWLSLIEVSGPFLSLPVLGRAFPQGLEPHQPERARLLRLAYDEWQDAVGSRRHAAPLHHAWVEFILTRLLRLPADLLLAGQAIPPAVVAHIPEHRETLRPDFVLVDSADSARPRLLVQMYPAGQHLDKPVAGHIWKASPATRMMDLLHATNVRLGLVTDGERWMLVDAPRNETTGFASWYATLWLEEPVTLRAFTSLLGADRFFNVTPADTLEALLAESAGNQQEVTDQLGYQVRRAVEVLVQSLDRVDQDAGRTLLAGVDEKSVYASALTVMMRLVFLFSAEERGLLLLHDELYAAHYAVSTLREQLRRTADQHGEEVLERRRDAWSRLLATFRAVFGGLRHDRLALPAYGGTLFDPDRYPFLEGRPAGTSWRDSPANPLPVHNRTVLHLLDALQMLEVKTPGGERQARRLSFRALDIEQIGHVYEGLLDHTARRAGAGEPVLGLKGTRAKEPEIRLAALEELSAREGGEALLERLREETGRSVNALRRDLLAGASSDTLLDAHATNRLRTACGQDEALFRRVLPFAGLVRTDTFDYPLVVLPGSLYVTAGSDRRSTGTHYTPRSLTEPIVRYTLEPLVYRGPAEGWGRERWELKTPRELLALKVCDLAMGSGAFLVAACRYLAARLVEAWAEVERANPAAFITSPEGDLSEGNPKEALVARLPDDERLHLAMRAVADRCLYGVDINPMAVEMAKLSLWLVTVDRARPFTFLDHALKCGDSLLGISDTRQLERFSLRESDAAQSLLETANLWRHIEQAAALRRQLEGLPSHIPAQLAEKARLHAEAEGALAKLRAAADFLLAAEMDNPGDRGWDTRRAIAASHMQAGWKKGTAEFQSLACTELRGRRAFHWPLEYPEIFGAEESDESLIGFDAFVGNPPFMGGKQMPTILTPEYCSALKQCYDDSKGAADLVAYFFRRAFTFLGPECCTGLVATKSIAETATRAVGLEQIITRGGMIFRAESVLSWPGIAAVVVATVHLYKGVWNGVFNLDGNPATSISSSLSNDLDFAAAKKLNHGVNYSEGTKLYGAAFVRPATDVPRLLHENPGLSPYLRSFVNGDVLNGTPDGKGDSFAIDFGELDESEIAHCSTIIAELKDTVTVERSNQTRQIHESRPWLHWDKRTNFFVAARRLHRVLGCVIVSSNLAFAFVDPNSLFAHGIKLFADSRASLFGCLQSTVHELWVRAVSSKLGESNRYSTSTSFDTFALPADMNGIEIIGEHYYEHRRQSMLARDEGLTKTYNRFHFPDETAANIAELRALHRQLDTAVAAAYGWVDLADDDGAALGHGFHETKQGTRYTFAPAARREVLDRLLALNHQRHAEEVTAGLHQKSKPAKSQKPRAKSASGAPPQIEFSTMKTPDLFT